MRYIDSIMDISLYFLLVICNINKFSYGNIDKNALPSVSTSNAMTLPIHNDVQQEHMKNSFDQSSNKDDDNDLNLLRTKRNDIGFVRLGKNNLKNSFLRFGKSSKNQNFVRLGRNDKETNDQSFIRFGRNDKNFVRFGRNNNNNNDDTNEIDQNNEPSMKFGRRGDKFIRFGRTDKHLNITTPDHYDSSIEHNDISAVTTADDDNLIPIKWNKNTNKFVRLGRSPGFIRLGKKLMLLNKKNEEYEKNLTPGIGKRTNVLLSPLYNKHKIMIMEHDLDNNINNDNDNDNANPNDLDSNFVSTNTEDKLIVPLPIQIYLNQHKILKTIPSDGDNEIDYEQDNKFNSNYLENEYLNEINQP